MKLYFPSHLRITSKSLPCKINAKVLIVVDYQIPIIKTENFNGNGKIYRFIITIQIYENGGIVISVWGQTEVIFVYDFMIVYSNIYCL